jgi:hypothetical protein
VMYSAFAGMLSRTKRSWGSTLPDLFPVDRRA